MRGEETPESRRGGGEEVRGGEEEGWRKGGVDELRGRGGEGGRKRRRRVERRNGKVENGRPRATEEDLRNKNTHPKNPLTHFSPLI